MTPSHSSTTPPHESFEPLVRPLPRWMSPEYCFQRLAAVPGCVWLDSSMQNVGQDRQLGRYSYLSTDPFTRLRLEKNSTQVLKQLEQFSQQFQQPKLAWLPPMQGGWMGWFGYELGGCFEKISPAQTNEFSLPLLSLGLYDVVLSWDHAVDQGWVISQGFPVREPRERERFAYTRLQKFMELLDNTQPPPPLRENYYPMAESRLSAQYETRWKGWTSNFSSAQYRKAVQRVVEYIYAGDIFQANLSQRLLTKAACSSATLYQHLRQVSPAPFSGYADLGRIQVISSSPERFLSLVDGELETRPIKGTKPRLSEPIADVGIGQLLASSEKDRAENVMIVDLLRNDLSRVSEYDSVLVDSLCSLEQYPFVWHLVSSIRSRLRSDLCAADVLRATFPGGSITGAPKIRAMEIISELEPTVRGPYCGCLGYLSFAGDMDLNILIRTVTACEGWWQVPVGGGIVAASQAEAEEQETWHKAEGILQAIDSLGVRSVSGSHRTHT